LFLYIVEKLVAYAVCIIDAVLYGSVPGKEVFVHCEHHAHLFILQELALDSRTVLTLCNARRDLSADGLHHALELVDAKSLFEYLNLLQVVCVGGRLKQNKKID